MMDLDTMRLWALRVMGSLPLRCRCAFVVVNDSICVFPCDAAGRLDLRQTFVLRSRCFTLAPLPNPPSLLPALLRNASARAWAYRRASAGPC